MSRRKQNNPRAFKALHAPDLIGSLKWTLPTTTEHAQITVEPLAVVNTARENSSPYYKNLDQSFAVTAGSTKTSCCNGGGGGMTLGSCTQTSYCNDDAGGFPQVRHQDADSDADAIRKRLKRWEAPGNGDDAIGGEGSGGSGRQSTPAGEPGNKGGITSPTKCGGGEDPLGGEARVNSPVKAGDAKGSTAEPATSVQPDSVASCLLSDGTAGRGSGQAGGNTTCLRCDIQFCHLKNFLVHKRFYCESRHSSRDKQEGRQQEREKGHACDRKTEHGHRTGVENDHDSDAKEVAEQGYSLSTETTAREVETSSGGVDQPLDLSLKKRRVMEEAMARAGGILGLEAGSEVSSGTRPLRLPGQPMPASGCLHICMWCSIAFSRLENLTVHQKFYCPAMLALKQQQQQQQQVPARQNPRCPAPVVLAHHEDRDGLAQLSPNQAPGQSSSSLNNKQKLGLSAMAAPPVLNGTMPAATFPPVVLYSCEHCNISFKRSESLAAHKTFYCSGRQLGKAQGEEEGEESGEVSIKEDTVDSTDICNSSHETVPGQATKVGDGTPAESIEPAQPVKIKALVKLKHCKSCDISFNSLSNFITHKKFYCSSQGPKTQNK